MSASEMVWFATGAFGALGVFLTFSALITLGICRWFKSLREHADAD